jgi:hypothetical protein
MNPQRRELLMALAALPAMRARAQQEFPMSSPQKITLDGEALQALTAEAYLYAYPLLMAYGFMVQQLELAPEAERQPVNRFKHFRSVATPTFNNYIPWVGTDTVYSSSWLDVRAEPLVFESPEFEPHRFQNIQMEDLYTHNVLNRGTRTHGNAARRYLFAGPGWSGEKPAGIDEVLVFETWLLKFFMRIAIEGPDDFEALHQLQDRYSLQPLSSYLKQAAPKPAPKIEWLQPDAPRWFECAKPEFVRYLNFVLGLCTIHSSEQALMQRFKAIGITPGADFDASVLSESQRAAMQAGIDASRARVHARVAHLDDPTNGWVYPLDLRGPRSLVAGSDDAFLRRATLANYAIWGPESAEVVYMSAALDADGHTLDGKHRYVLHFDRPPPVKGFWSYTIYDAKTRLLVDHPSGRYKLSDRMPMRYGPDGSLTLYVQNESPGSAHESNWLPVPKQPFHVVARLYWPQPELLDGRYKPPGLRKI